MGRESDLHRGEDARERGEDGDSGPAEAAAGDDRAVASPRLIVGLGNPGRRYEATRHNIGFRVVSRILSSCSAGREERAFRSRLWRTEVAGRELVLLLPQTYMNLSGEAVRACAEALGIRASEILVICDDFQLPLGKIRIRRRGSSGGHKGLDSVIGCLGTESFPRLRVGVGDPGSCDAESYVLEPFWPEESDAIEAALGRAAEAADAWLRLGIDEAMRLYNG